MTRLTLRRLGAIRESLNARLAGELNAEMGDDFWLQQKDYEGAFAWVEEEIERRKPQLDEDGRLWKCRKSSACR